MDNFGACERTKNYESNTVVFATLIHHRRTAAGLGLGVLARGGLRTRPRTVRRPTGGASDASRGGEITYRIGATLTGWP